MSRVTTRTTTGVGEKQAVAAAKKSAAKIQSVPETQKTAIKVTPEERYRMIAEAAYYKAQKRGFVGGDPAKDWLEAEAEIDRKLAGK